MEMAESTYWDKAEYNFFETLEDEDKLIYLYDLMIGEFSYMEIHNEMEDLDKQEKDISEMFKQLGEAAADFNDDDEEEDSDIWDFETERSEVKIEFLKEVDSNYISIIGPTLELLLKVANDLQMNGMILTDKEIEFTKYEPWNVILTYKLIGNGPPFSIN
jgi:hypothetical protein|tara:strand:- start:642 stop:1121 length:480 start_codon:yes stop_codon:yes gene_type:complete